ncbi:MULTISPECIES: porin [unclassified Methylophilus]|uniref:porin n=1 Tax=unclassified Methylophilus TaxID=2630143 RepID=UPI0006F7394B|nr:MULTISPECIES: porin [unclassified Methylophilus]KQT41581.1 porin [Methylophilus sp. Leaf416]KQT55747.1 porin [Methylophilus sp. Leaf459]
MNSKLHRIVLAAVASSMLAGLSFSATADSNIDLVQALVSKGVLTEEEGALLTKGRNTEVEVQKKKESKSWTSRVNLRGYVQVRNTTMLGGDEGVNLWSDRSVGDDQSLGDADKNFLIRRARLIIFGDFGDHLSYYIQPDFASSVGGTTNSNASGAGNFAQLRDAYGDVYIDKTRVHRIRVGQSKVPYGFENLQSSSNRLALDRNDALNSAVRDERDLGAFYYYTPTDIQALFEDINKQGLKHSGNYGMFALGLYNGQGANARDQNDNYHVVSRFTYPWKTDSGQIYEAGIQAYRGDYVSTVGNYSRRNAAGVLASATPNLGTGIAPASGRNGIEDERVGISFIMYPQPFGIQAEWNWGNTPGLDISKNIIEKKSLNGGYVQAMYKIDNFQFLSTNGTLIPFVKWQYFDGYNKAETNSPENHVNDWELGVEWQLAPEVEIAMVYHRMNRTNLVTGNRVASAANTASNLQPREDYENFKAEALRVQLQYNF